MFPLGEIQSLQLTIACEDNSSRPGAQAKILASACDFSVALMHSILSAGKFRWLYCQRICRSRPLLHILLATSVVKATITSPELL